ncbi:MAG TPA: Fur family transcriptional regulator [Promineifilum sp.]
MKNHLASALEKRGYRLTAARAAILDALTDSGGHLTADDLTEMVRRRRTGIGRMTVYRTLDLLCDLGLLRPVYQGTGAAHYIILEDGHHHHLICSGCGRVIEFDQCALEMLHDDIDRRFRFRVDGHLLELYGQCDACRT